jgi:SnoaL-like protein
VTTDLEFRIHQLEDRTRISEQVIKYAMGVDRRDWAMFADCFTDPVYADFSAGGVPAETVARDELVGRISVALNGFTATQHISPNHVIEFDDNDPDRAVCYSYMFAQHLIKGSENGEYYLLRGSYTNHMLRTADGWRIERIIQHRSWEYGNKNAVTEAIARSEAKASA